MEAAAEVVAAEVAAVPKKRKKRKRKKRKLTLEAGICSEVMLAAAGIIRSLLPHQRRTNPFIQTFHYNPLLLVFLKHARNQTNNQNNLPFLQSWSRSISILWVSND